MDSADQKNRETGCKNRRDQQRTNFFRERKRDPFQNILNLAGLAPLDLVCICQGVAERPDFFIGDAAFRRVQKIPLAFRLQDGILKLELVIRRRAAAELNFRHHDAAVKVTSQGTLIQECTCLEDSADNKPDRLIRRYLERNRITNGIISCKLRANQNRNYRIISRVDRH